MLKPIIDVIIPAYNEEQSIGNVLADIPRELVREVIVCNNASTDRTAEVARAGGATVLDQPEKGYGAACLKGIEYLQQKAAAEQPQIVVFIDGDYSDHPEEIALLIQPILHHNADMVIGSSALRKMQQGAMMPHNVFGNWLASPLIKLF